jgi:cell division septum initiation protein DivIVA
MTTNEHALLEAALIGYQHQAEQLAQKIADIQKQLSGKSPSAASKAAAPVKRRAMSAAARKRIAAAQKKRWAEYHRLKEAKS